MNQLRAMIVGDGNSDIAVAGPIVSVRVTVTTDPEPFDEDIELDDAIKPPAAPGSPVPEPLLQLM